MKKRLKSTKSISYNYDATGYLVSSVMPVRSLTSTAPATAPTNPRLPASGDPPRVAGEDQAFGPQGGPAACRGARRSSVGHRDR